MTAGLKVRFQGFQICKSADICNVKCKCSIILSKFLFFQTVNTEKSFKYNTHKIVATVSPAVHSDLWKDSFPRKVSFSASSKCLEIGLRAQSVRVRMVKTCFKGTVTQDFWQRFCSWIYKAQIFKLKDDFICSYSNLFMIPNYSLQRRFKTTTDFVENNCRRK